MATSPPSDPGTSSRAALLSAAQAFCEAFATKSTPPAELVSKFFASPPDGKRKVDILAFEHALVGAVSPQSRAKELLPFLGKPFRGAEGVRAYFEAVGGVLDYRDMRFDFGRSDGDGGDGVLREAEGDDQDECGFSPFVVDVEGRQVCVKGKGKFSCKATGQEWDESFIYKLGYVFEEEEWKVLRFEVWADPAAAFLAAKGEL